VFELQALFLIEFIKLATQSFALYMVDFGRMHVVSEKIDLKPQKWRVKRLQSVFGSERILPALLYLAHPVKVPTFLYQFA
jgi:hypothetical protein